MLKRVKRLARALFPDYSARGRVVRRIAKKFGLAKELSYAQAFGVYVATVEPKSFYPPVAQTHDPENPLFSVIVPFFNTAEKYLVPLMDSLSGQSFHNWELILADASTDEGRAKRIEGIATTDPRFRYLRLRENQGISGNTNAGIAQARGRYLAFVDHDDTISPHALNEVAQEVTARDDVGIVYSDEDLLTDDGRFRKGPFFKPCWSPHMFYQMNYTNHLSVIRADLVSSVGGLRPDLDGAQDYDLLLRIHAKHPDVVVAHIPKILYHWREARHSTARNISAKTYAIDAGNTALREHLDAIGVSSAGVDSLPHRPGWYRIHPRQKCRAEVIIMVAEDQRANEQFATWLKAKTACEWVEPRFTCVPSSTDLRAYCESGDDEVLVVFRGMYLPKESSWLDELAGTLALPNTAAVAPLLMANMHKEILNAGLMEKMGELRPLYKGSDVTDGGLAGPADILRDVDGLSPAVVAFPRATPHHSLFAPGDVDGRGWSDLLVLWGHLRFMLVRLPYRDKRLNDNLALSASTVVLRTELNIE